MALNISTPPSESLQALQSAASNYPEILGMTGVDFSSIDPAGAGDLMPHKVFTVGLDDLAAGNGLQNAELVAWRYIVQRSGAAGYSVETNVDANGRHSFAQVNQGPFVDQTTALVAQVQKSERVQSGSYEFTVLRIPALYVMALWLRNTGGGDDIIVPMNPTAVELEAGRQYGAATVSTILAEAARDRASFNDVPQA